MLAALVNTKDLLQVVIYSLLAGIGVAVAFSFSILGATRFDELRRDGRLVAAGLFGVVAVLGLALSAGAVVLGIVELAGA